MTDPGAFSSGQELVTDLDVVLITHEHPDHLHTASLEAILKNNPEVRIISNSAVARKLKDINLYCEVVEGRNSIKIGSTAVEAFDGQHGEIFEDFGQVQNTGYFIADKFFYPGDSFHDPERAVDVLALPVAGPWCPIGDAIRYALEVKPRKTFPVHDGMIQADKTGIFHGAPDKILGESGIEFVVMKEGDEREF